MSVIILLISASLIIALGFLAAFVWSVKSGQYDDDYTPSVRMLFENPNSPSQQETDKTNNKTSQENKTQTRNKKTIWK